MTESHQPRLNRAMKTYLHSENGAISVDYTVLAAAALGAAIATTAVLTGGIDFLTSRVDDELRTRQLNDSFIAFAAGHFNPLLEAQMLTEEDASLLFAAANDKMNQPIIDQIEQGIQKMDAGTITQQEFLELWASASVAYQRNIIDDGVLNYYFGFDDGQPDWPGYDSLAMVDPPV